MRSRSSEGYNPLHFWDALISEKVLLLENICYSILEDLNKLTGVRNMPLLKGEKARTKKGFEENVETEIKAGKPKKKALATSYSEAKPKKKKKKKK